MPSSWRWRWCRWSPTRCSAPWWCACLASRRGCSTRWRPTRSTRSASGSSAAPSAPVPGSARSPSSASSSPPPPRSPCATSRAAGSRRERDGYALHERVEAERAREVADAREQARRERDALAPATRLALRLRLARDVDAVVALGPRRRLERVEEVVHVALEVGEGPEARGIDGDEAMAGVLQLALGAIGAHVEVAVDGARQDAGEDVHHDREPVALVAAQLARAADRRLQAMLHGHVGIGRRLALVVERPAGRDRFAPAAGDAQLAEGHRGRR